jgi:hypothetical protein
LESAAGSDGEDESATESSGSDMVELDYECMRGENKSALRKIRIVNLEEQNRNGKKRGKVGMRLDSKRVCREGRENRVAMWTRRVARTWPALVRTCAREVPVTCTVLGDAILIFLCHISRHIVGVTFVDSVFDFIFY